MGADLDKIKKSENDEDDEDSVSHEDARDEEEEEEEEEEEQVKHDGCTLSPEQAHGRIRKRSGSIYGKPKWQDQVHEKTDDSAPCVLFSGDDEPTSKLSRAYTVASCRFRRKMHTDTTSSPSMRVIREEPCMVMSGFVSVHGRVGYHVI
jgi:hypothetical protein